MKLPRAPDARVRTGDDKTSITDAEVKGLLLNPSYVFGGIIDEGTFVSAAQRLIAESSLEDYLTNLLFVMMRSLTPYIDPHQAIPNEAAWLDWAKSTVDDLSVEAGLKIILADLREKYGQHFVT